MGLCPPFLLTSMLKELQDAGISVVHQDDRWFVERMPERQGPFHEPQTALEQGMRWLALLGAPQDDENSPRAARPA